MCDEDASTSARQCKGYIIEIQYILSHPSSFQVYNYHPLFVQQQLIIAPRQYDSICENAFREITNYHSETMVLPSIHV